MGLRLSASQIYQALHCGFPYRDDVVLTGENLVGKAAYSGQLFASMRENFFHSDRSIVVPKRADAKAANRWFQKWKKWWSNYSAQHPNVKWYSEVPFAFNFINKTARILPISQHRGYVGLTNQEIPGTADIVGVGPRRVFILDDKTGSRDNVEPVAKNMQLKFLAMCASLVYKRYESTVGLVFPRDDDNILEESHNVHIDMLPLFSSIPDIIAKSSPKIGDHCWKCPLRLGGCPKYDKIDAMFGTYNPHNTIKAKNMRKRRLPTTSQDVVETPEDNSFAPGPVTRQKERPAYHVDFERIIERIYSIDIKKEYDRLEQALVLGEKRSDRGTLAKAVDEAENNARRAHEIYLCAVRERTRWEAEAEIVMAPLRKHANEALQALKADGLHSKIITDADVRAKMASQHPEEFKWHEEHSAKIKGLEEATKKMSEVWTSRCASVRLMYDKAR